MNERPSPIRRLCFSAVVAALYACLTLVLPIPAYGPIQFRMAEALTLLPFLFPQTVPGLAVGCFLANLLGSPYALDWVFGTLATLLAALWTAKLRHKWLAAVPPVVCNCLIVGFEIAWATAGTSPAFLPLWGYNALTVGLGELAVCATLGMLLLTGLPRIPFFREMIPAHRLSRL